MCGCTATAGSSSSPSPMAWTRLVLGVTSAAGIVIIGWVVLVGLWLTVRRRLAVHNAAEWTREWAESNPGGAGAAVDHDLSRCTCFCGGRRVMAGRERPGAAARLTAPDCIGGRSGCLGLARVDDPYRGFARLRCSDDPCGASVARVGVLGSQGDDTSWRPGCPRLVGS